MVVSESPYCLFQAASPGYCISYGPSGSAGGSGLKEKKHVYF